MVEKSKKNEIYVYGAWFMGLGAFGGDFKGGMTPDRKSEIDCSERLNHFLLFS